MNDYDPKIEDTVAHLSWLEQAWEKQIIKVSQWSTRLAAEGEAQQKQGNSPRLTHRFAAMLQQVNFFKAKEAAIIDEIRFFERQHAFLRKTNRLRRAESERELEKEMKRKATLAINDNPPKPQRNKRSFLMNFLLGMWIASSRTSTKEND